MEVMLWGDVFSSWFPNSSPPINRGNLDSVSGHVYHCISLEGQWPPEMCS